jgi:PAS domain S-box-containing protein
MQLLHHSRLQLIEERLDLAVYVCSAKGECEWVSEAISDLFGIDREKFVGYGWLEAIIGDEREGIHKKWKYAIENGLPYEASYTVRHQRTHRLIPCRTEAFPVFSGVEHELSFYVGFVERAKTGKTE